MHMTRDYKPSNLLVYVPAGILMLLPPILGFVYISFNIIYAGGLRSVVYDLSWLSFAFIFVAISNFSKVSLAEVGKGLPRSYLAIFLVFTIVWIYTTTIVAENPIMAYYTSGRGFIAILVGLAAAALKQAYGKKFATSIEWALFAGVIFHAPFLIWVYVLEGQNPDFEWLLSLPAYPGLRLYNHAIEAGVAAGLGLYFLTERQSTQRRAAIMIGTTLLWMLLFWGGARGTLIALFASFILLGFIIPQFTSRMWKFFLSTMIIGASLSLFLPAPHDAYGLFKRIQTTVESETLSVASTGRMEMWADAITIFLERPFFGHGLVQYQHLTNILNPDTREHVHNILLESLISFGIVGTTALIYLIGKILIASALELRAGKTDSDLPMFLISITLLTHGFVSGTYFHMHSMLTIAIALGLLLHTLVKSP